MGKTKWTKETIEEWTKENKFTYKILDFEIKNKNPYILIKCPNTEHESYWILLSAFINKEKECKYCSKEDMFKDKDEYVSDCVKLKLNNYKLLDIKRDSRGAIKVFVQCENKLHPPYWVKFRDVNKGGRCIKCQGKIGGNKRRNRNPLVTNIYKQKVFDLCQNEFIVLGEYKNMDTKVLMYHTECENEFEVNPHSFLRNKSFCPYCSKKQYKGEKIIKKFLTSQSIVFEPQKTFNDCRNKNKLPFDFYLLDYNLLIEYQGGQHYKPIEYFGGQEQFEYRQNNDQIKKDYCQQNNIPLLEIPYWEFDNIETIINKHLLLIKEEVV